MIDVYKFGDHRLDSFYTIMFTILVDEQTDSRTDTQAITIFTVRPQF